MREMAEVDLVASTAKLKLALFDDIGGNNQGAAIEVESDGGQFDQSIAGSTGSGFVLNIRGTWELEEFVQGLMAAAKKLGVIK